MCVFTQCTDTMPSVDSAGKEEIREEKNLEEEDGLVDFPIQQTKSQATD